MRKFRILLLLIFLILQSCKNNDESNASRVVEKYADGTYCAEVTYFNPNNSATKMYMLNVEVLNNTI